MTPLRFFCRRNPSLISPVRAHIQANNDHHPIAIKAQKSPKNRVRLNTVSNRTFFDYIHNILQRLSTDSNELEFRKRHQLPQPYQIQSHWNQPRTTTSPESKTSKNERTMANNSAPSRASRAKEKQREKEKMEAMRQRNQNEVELYNQYAE